MTGRGDEQCNVESELVSKCHSHSYTDGLTPTPTMIVDHLKSMYLAGTKKDSTYELGGMKKERNNFLLSNANPPTQQPFTKYLDIATVFNNTATALY